MTKMIRIALCSLTVPLLLISGVFSLAAAEEYWLRAAATTIDLPDDSAVPMWGYALDTDNNFTTVDGTVMVPGPPLTVTPGSGLTIHLHNDLPEPTSLVIPGQNSLKPEPVFFTSGPFTGRVRSFTAEAAAAGGEVTYVYPMIAPGTYLYQSGSHPGVQVPMGLYGALSADAAAGQVYTGKSYAQSLTYLFSEIDVAQHRAVDDLSYGTPDYPSTMNVGYQPDYFLLNGRSYTPGDVPETLSTGSQVLLRFLNAGLRGRVPVIPGITFDLLAEDGNPYATVKKQTSIDLPAGKTLDVLITTPGPGSERYLALIDRRLGLSDAGRTSQGMLAYMAVGTPGVNLHVAAPGSSADLITVSSLPGGLSCGSSCDQSFLTGTEVTLSSLAGSGDSLTAWRVYDGDPGAGGTLLTGLCASLGDCNLTLSADRWVVPVFSGFGSLTILSPEVSEILGAGERYEIRWAAPAAAVSFNIGYRLGPGTPWVLIATGTTEKKAYWQVPNGLNLRGNSQLAVASFDAGGNFLESVQTVLGLQVRDSVTLQMPNGGQMLTVGDAGDDPYSISWSDLMTQDAVSRVGLWYQLASGAPWQHIATVAGNQSSYSWALPAVSTAASAARVGVVLYNTKGEVLVMDTSDAVFSIQPAVVSASSSGLVDTAATVRVSGTAVSLAPEAPPSLQLQGPTAAEVLNMKSGYTVLWQSLVAADSFSLTYSLDLGHSWQPLAQDLVGDQYAWQIDPALQGEKQVLLRLEAFGPQGESMAKAQLPEPFAIE